MYMCEDCNYIYDGDIYVKCPQCGSIDIDETKPTILKSSDPLLGDVTSAEVDIIVDALYDYQLHIMGIKELEETNFAVKIILDKLTKDLPEIE